MSEIKKYFLWFYLLIKRLLKKIGVWIIIVIIPIIFNIYTHGKSSDNNESMRVGLILEDNDEISQKTVEKLINGDFSVNFYIEDSRDKLIYDINNEKTICGYIFSENLTNKLDTLNIKGCIKVVVSSSDFMSSMINEMVFSELFKTYGGNIAINNIETSEIFGVYNKEAIASLEDKYSLYNDSDKTFHIDFKNVDGIDNMQSDVQNNVEFSIKGIIAIIVVIAGLTGCVWWNYEKKRGMFKAMREIQCYIGAFLYVVTVTFPIAVSGLITIFTTGSKTLSVGAEIVNMIVYVLIIGIIGTILCMIVRDRMFLISFIPVYAIICLIACPVFFDLATLIPAVKYIRWILLPYYYL